MSRRKISTLLKGDKRLANESFEEFKLRRNLLNQHRVYLKKISHLGNETEIVSKGNLFLS